jgi:protein-S-isoprenylcysteine O-methyltransferase Ste14
MALLLKNLLFTVLVPGTVAVLVPLSIAGERAPAAGVFTALSLLLLGIGAAIYTWCVFDFAAFGRGTPAPIDAPQKLVVRGLYRFTRNPMYVGVLLVVTGFAAPFGSVEVAVYAACLSIAFNLFIRLYEEPHLARVFGVEYAAYRARVGRWLPRIPPTRQD